MTRKQLEAKAKKLAQKFHDDAQALFDDDGMTEEIYDREILQALLMAQSAAGDVLQAEG
jgi:hypothetical protein